jgi:SAM-dependent methyltransferase
MNGGGDIDTNQQQLESVLLSKNYPKVDVLTNEIIQTTPKEKFVWLEKTDGIRQILVIKNGSIKTHDIDVSIGTINMEKLTILDTELYNNKWYIFDSCCYNGEDISALGYIERMQKINIDDPRFVKKSYYKINDWSDVISFIENYKSPITGIIIDGVVCQRVDLGYFTTSSFKLKPSSLNTIDFKLKYVDSNTDSQKCFYLYLIGTKYDLINSMKRYSQINPKSVQHAGYNFVAKTKLDQSILILFSSPYIENMYYFKPRTVWRHGEFQKERIQVVNSLMYDILRNPTTYNDKILEMSYAPDGWVPLKIREDKQFPNGYKIGISVSSLIFNPVVAGNTYFNPIISPTPLQLSYHEISHEIRDVIFGNIPAIKTVLDLAGGRGADLQRFDDIMLKNIFALDSDKNALVRYCQKVQKLAHGIKFNAICGELSDNNSNILKETQSRFEYPKGGFDCVLMNYAIHYLCNKRANILELSKFVKTVLNENGIFIFSRFDGDRILADMKNNELKLTSFEIKTTAPKAPSDSDAVWASMPLPTIDSSGYRDEPLALQSILNSLEGLHVVKEFYPIDYLQTGNESLNLFYDYIKYIKVTIMNKTR